MVPLLSALLRALFFGKARASVSRAEPKKTTASVKRRLFSRSSDRKFKNGLYLTLDKLSA